MSVGHRSSRTWFASSCRSRRRTRSSPKSSRKQRSRSRGSSCRVAQWHPQDISDFQVLGPCIALKREYVAFGHTACRGELTENDKLQEPRTEKAAGAGYILGFDTKEKAEYFTQVLACRLNSDDSRIQVSREKAEPNNVFLYRTIKRGQNHRINNEKLKNARTGLVEFATELANLAKQIEVAPCHSVYRVTNASDVRNS